MSESIQRMFDANVRVENAIYIPGAVVDADSTPEVFSEEFCENLPEGEGRALYRQLPALTPFANGEEWPEPADVAEAIRFTSGFLIRAATPVFDYRPDYGSSASFSWGHYYTEWLYAASEADIAAVCVEWAEGRHAADKAKAMARAIAAAEPTP